ncbi:hypothetical protein MRX96_032800 [Rhipicephalus microplus]
MQILQMAMAETLAASGIGNKSFCLECTEEGKAVVHVFESELRYGEARAMTSEDIWNYVATELMNSKLRDGDRCKFVAFLSWTRYQGDGVRPTTHGEVMKRVSGHVMVGAGGLALCGTGCLYTWAQNADELSWEVVRHEAGGFTYVLWTTATTGARFRHVTPALWAVCYMN